MWWGVFWGGGGEGITAGTGCVDFRNISNLILVRGRSGLYGLVDLKNDFHSSKTFYCPSPLFIRHSLLYCTLGVVYLEIYNSMV